MHSSNESEPSAQPQVGIRLLCLHHLEVVVWHFFDYDNSTNKCMCKVETVSGVHVQQGTCAKQATLWVRSHWKIPHQHAAAPS